MSHVNHRLALVNAIASHLNGLVQELIPKVSRDWTNVLTANPVIMAIRNGNRDALQMLICHDFPLANPNGSSLDCWISAMRQEGMVTHLKEAGLRLPTDEDQLDILKGFACNIDNNFALAELVLAGLKPYTIKGLGLPAAHCRPSQEQAFDNICKALLSTGFNIPGSRYGIISDQDLAYIEQVTDEHLPRLLEIKRQFEAEKLSENVGNVNPTRRRKML